MKSFRQFIIENKVSDLNVPTGKDAKGFDWTALQRQVRKYKEKLGKSISQTEIDRLIKSRGLPEKEAQANMQGKMDAQADKAWQSSFDNEDPTDPWFDDDPKKKTKLKNTTKIRVKGKPFGKPSGIDPNIGKPKYVPPKDVPKGETGRRARRRTWDYEKVQRDIDRADAKKAREGKGEYRSKRVNQGDVSKRARKYTQKINRKKITSDADKFITRLRKGTKLQSRMDRAVSTSQKPGTLSQRTNELLKDIRLKGTPKSSVISPKTYLSKGGQTSLFPDPQTVTPPPEPKTQRTGNWRKWRQTTLDFNKKTPKVTKDPQKTYNQMQKDISKVRGKKSTFTKSNISHKIKSLTKKIPKTGIDPFTAIQGYARQRDVKKATPARAITGGALKGLSSWQGFRQGAKLSTAAALKVTKHPAYVGAAGLVGGLTGAYLSSTGTEYAFDQALGKRGTTTATATQTQIEKEKNKTKTKVITGVKDKKNKGVIVSPVDKKKKPISFALNPAKVN